jgi:hypothetical protein
MRSEALIFCYSLRQLDKLLKGNRFVLKFWVLQRAMLSHRLFARSILREHVVRADELWCGTTDNKLADRPTIIAFTSRNLSRITSAEATMAACNPFIFWMFVSTTFIPRLSTEKGDDQSSIRTIGVGRWRSLFSATASSPHQSSPYDVLFHRCLSQYLFSLRYRASKLA